MTQDISGSGLPRDGSRSRNRRRRGGAYRPAAATTPATNGHDPDPAGAPAAALGPAKSFASTSIVFELLFCRTLFESSFANGVSLTGVMVMVSVCGALVLTLGAAPDPLSWTRTS